MENKSSINISKLTSDKGVKKLDLQNIKSLRHDSISGGFRESNPVILSNNYKNNGDKEVRIYFRKKIFRKIIFLNKLALNIILYFLR